MAGCTSGKWGPNFFLSAALSIFTLNTMYDSTGGQISTIIRIDITPIGIVPSAQATCANFYFGRFFTVMAETTYTEGNLIRIGFGKNLKEEGHLVSPIFV